MASRSLAKCSHDHHLLLQQSQNPTSQLQSLLPVRALIPLLLCCCPSVRPSVLPCCWSWSLLLSSLLRILSCPCYCRHYQSINQSKQQQQQKTSTVAAEQIPSDVSSTTRQTAASCSSSSFFFLFLFLQFFCNNRRREMLCCYYCYWIFFSNF